MTPKKEKQINFQLKGIELLDVLIKHPKQALPANTSFHFNINLKHKINAENKLVFVISSIKVLLEDKKTELALLTVSCIYNVPEIEKFFEQETKQVKFPNEFVIKLNTVSLSTTRGVMFSEFKGTFLHNAYLPLIDIHAFNVNK